MPSWFAKRGRHRKRDSSVPTLSSVPAGTVVYAIGDIHGRLDLLQRLEAKIQHDAAGLGADRRLIVCLGDYIDRGDNSYGVIEHLLQEPPESFERICLTGNHEAYLVRFFDDSTVAAAWLDNGGRETLLSYGVPPPARPDHDGASEALQTELLACLPPSHEAFLRTLALSHREGDYLFVHAGVRPGVPFDRQDPHDLIWIREEFLNDGRDFGAVVVHGHSIRLEPDNLTNRIGVDTGGYATGRLTCVVLWGNERRFLST
ncbi:MAG: metallophosphoesterase [Alphaproteobacteria bacterium]|jgi:serine/threonine protein phosphatase 1|nr:metallophosphoesterase [Alphaproteobacteria bacterium]